MFSQLQNKAEKSSIYSQNKSENWCNLNKNMYQKIYKLAAL